MAKLMGASFYGGFLDIAAAPFRLLRFYETTFLRMQKKIFEDQAMMHEAYIADGMSAIEELRDAGIIDRATARAWDAINRAGTADLSEGNRWLLYREQDDILDQFYVRMHRHHVFEGSALTYLMTLVGRPSVPGAKTYPVVLPLTLAVGSLTLPTPLAEGNIAMFPDRWELIERDTLPAYRRLTVVPAELRELVSTPVVAGIDTYRLRSYWASTVTSMLSAWGTWDGAGRRVRPRRPVRVDLCIRSRRGPAVRAWADPRHKAFPVHVRLPEHRSYYGQAQLVKLYVPERPSSPTQLTVKLPAMGLDAAEETLRGLMREWRFAEDALTTWRAGVGGSGALGHHYSTRVFTAERVGFVEIEVQLEHHVAESQFIIDVLFTVAPLD